MTDIATTYISEFNNIFDTKIRNILDELFVITDDTGHNYRAEKAASCLMSPQIGDSVLVARVSSKLFVLAVLQQKDANKSNISLNGDVEFKIPNGSLHLSAQKGLHFSTPEDLNLIAKKFGITGDSLVTVVKKINFYGDLAEMQLQNLKFVSNQVKSTINVAIQQFGRRHANIDGLESTTAGTIKQTAKEIMNLKSKFAFIKAKKNIKMDGEQILMG